MTATADDDVIGLLIQPLTRIYDSCRWCHHEWHGMRCKKQTTCRCDGAMGRLDDTWRPAVPGTYLSQQLQIMHDTGVDGWTARECTPSGHSGSWVAKRHTLKRILYGSRA